MRKLLCLNFILEGVVIFSLNLMKHWTLLLLPKIIQTELKIKEINEESYIILNYVAFFYGTMIGTWVWELILLKSPVSVSIWLSLLLIAVSNYFMFLTNSFSLMIFFRFLKGMSMNNQKIGKAYVHEFMNKKSRKIAFLIENVSYVLGTLAGPFLGNYFYEKFHKNYYNEAVLISVMFIIVSISFIIINFIESSYKADHEVETNRIERFYFRDGITIIHNKNWKEVFIYCFFTNNTCRYLFFIYIIHSACFHIDLVMTTTFFRIQRHSLDVYLTKDQFANSILLGIIPSISFILILDNLSMTYGLKLFIKYTICFSCFTTLLTPFFRYFLSFYLERKKAQICLFMFYCLKITFSYYLYSNIFVRWLNLCIYKIYRKKFNVFVTFFKQLASAILFTLLIPLFRFIIHNEFYNTLEAYNYIIIFLLLAIIKGSTLLMMELFYLPEFGIF